jgi:hypothetical protein
LLLTGIALGVLFNPATGPATREWLKKNVLGEGDTSDFGGGSNGGLTGA